MRTWSNKEYYKRNLLLATPIMLSSFGQNCAQMVDTLMVARLGTTELAAISFASALTSNILMVIMGISMGLTPLGGIMMGTRTGDMDPSVFNYVVKVTGKSAEEVYQMFNKESGFKGMSTVGPDSRDVLAAVDAGNEHAILTNKLFVRRIADFIGQYYVRLGGCDLIIFSAGIGENEPRTRKEVVDQIKEALGVEIDESLNSTIHGKECLISTPNSKIKVAVIPTDEEVMIARDAYKMTVGK